MKCAIHQPNFLPWMGYFDKIKKVDKFVILDDVQVPKTGGGPWNRAKINLNGNISNLTVPFYRKSGLHKFNEIFYVNNEWRNKIKKTIFHSYSKSKNYSKYINYIESIIDFDSNNMAIYNTNAILSLSKLLGISGDKFVLSSSLNISTVSEQRIIDICKVVNSDTYYSGNGAKAYQSQQNFEVNGLSLVYQDPFIFEYNQLKSDDFIPGLSIIDYVFEAL